MILNFRVKTMKRAKEVRRKVNLRRLRVLRAMQIETT